MYGPQFCLITLLVFVAFSASAFTTTIFTWSLGKEWVQPLFSWCCLDEAIGLRDWAFYMRDGEKFYSVRINTKLWYTSVQ